MKEAADQVIRYKKRCEWVLLSLASVLWLVITAGCYVYPRARDLDDQEFELLATSTEVIWYTIIVVLFSIALMKIMLSLK